LENPRKIKKNAQMPPVTLTSDGFFRLLEILGATTFAVKE
jgi:hypothetical protein